MGRDKRKNRSMSTLTERLTVAIADAGYGTDEPVITGVHRQGRTPVFVAQGLTGAGQPVSAVTVAYAASLSKQITAACAAVLVREAVLDMDATLKSWLPELPAWAHTVRLRHLLHHTAALPDDEVDSIVGSTTDRTTPTVLAALSQIPALASRPGTAYAYSGVGYICLAAVVERGAGQSLPVFADTRIFAPLGMGSTRYWPGPAPAPPGAAPLGTPHPAPLSLGDGGIWSTAQDLLRWAQALNADELGISRLMETPGSLDDGTPVDYAWGMGIRSHAGYRVYRHGGGWPSLRALLARVPELNVSLVIMALADDSERRVDLAATMLDLVTAPV
jgi:CubicO group peptidase (beta-lactamase class C family)